MAWSSILKRRPKRDHEVLTFSPQRGTYLPMYEPGFIGHDGWFWSHNFGRLPHVTHWQELPKPPRVKYVTVTFELDAGLYNKIKAMAEEQRITISELVEDALRVWLLAHSALA